MEIVSMSDSKSCCEDGSEHHHQEHQHPPCQRATHEGMVLSHVSWCGVGRARRMPKVRNGA